MNKNSFLPDRKVKTFLTTYGYGVIGWNSLIGMQGGFEVTVTDEYILFKYAIFRYVLEKKHIEVIKNYQMARNSIQIIHTQPKVKKFVAFQTPYEAEPELKAVLEQAGYLIQQ